MFSDFWWGLALGSQDLLPAPTGSGAIDGTLRLPSFILGTLGDGAFIYGS